MAGMPKADWGTKDPCTLEYFAAYTAGRRLENVDGCNWAELGDIRRSYRIQKEIAQRHPAGGEPVGYKVTFANDGRVVGVITDAMLLATGSTIEISTGARLLGEADLLVRVGADSINRAKTTEDIAASIDAVFPLIESSDMMLPDGAARTKAIWTASNANARWGVLGDQIDLSHMTPATRLSIFEKLEVELFDEAGRSLQSSGMRDNPLERVLDVIGELQRRDGLELKVGDLISLGNFGRPRFPETGSSLTAVFHGLADPPPTVSVRYE